MAIVWSAIWTQSSKSDTKRIPSTVTSRLGWIDVPDARNGLSRFHRSIARSRVMTQAAASSPLAAVGAKVDDTATVADWVSHE